MTQDEEIALLPAYEIRKKLESKDLSPVEVVEACLQQIERYNSVINAVVTVNEKALEEAKKLENAKEKGLLYGLPVGIKDVTETAGIRTTYGCPLYDNYIPEEDALVVQRLKAAGAIILGKTNTPEFAAGGNTFNEVFGRTCNPWNPELSAGGSTGGGAAGLITGMIALAQGTDLGGSLRIPASFCGVVGLRPSPGLVPTYPSDYLWDNLQVTGPMARTVEDVALMLQAVSGQSPLCPVYQPTRGRDFVAAVQNGVSSSIRLAYCRDIAGIGVDEEVEHVCRAAAFNLKDSGAEVEEIHMDLSFGWQAFLALRGYWMVAHQYNRLDKIDHFGPNLAGNIRAGLEVTARELGAAEQARNRIWRTFYEFFQKYDYLLTPCMAIPPFPVQQNYPETIAGKKMKTYVDWIAPTFILSLTSLPVASVPCGLDNRGLPVGLQIVGKPLGEESVLALAAQVQKMNPTGFPHLITNEKSGEPDA